MVDEKLYECPEGCMNKDKACMNCVEGDKFVPLIEISAKLRKVGSKSNPSYVLPVDKALIKERKIDVKKKVRGVISQ